MRVAILSDIHGNSIALDAVLADVIECGGADAYWVVGDLVAYGPDPVGVIERVTALPNARCVRGNTDRCTVADEWRDHNPSWHEAEQDPAELRRLVKIVRSLSWTRGAVTAAGWLDWLVALPVEERVTLPDGTRVLLVHASPGRDGGHGIDAEMGEAELRETLAGCEADLVIVGHTHIPLDRTVDGVRAFNLGSVSNPVTDDLRAMYALLEADASGYRIERRYADYDRQAAIEHIQRARHPDMDRLTGRMDGSRQRIVR